MHSTLSAPSIPRRVHRGWLGAGLALAFAASGAVAAEGGLIAIDENPEAYGRVVATGPIAGLQQKLEAGGAKLSFADGHGYLGAVLEELKVPLSSQVLVFSKTSLQRPDISPINPRAIYFNDQVYVAWVPGAGLLEVSAFDPVLGAVWYTLDQERSDSPRFERNDRCLECHVTSKTRGVPGHLARSNIPGEDGSVGLLESSAVTDQTWPLRRRWGGWYVTGSHGGQTHLGNVAGAELRERMKTEPNPRGNLIRLEGLFDVGKYPERHSDIVALMVMDHQIQMQNLLTLLKYECNLHEARYGHIRYLNDIAREVLKYMLFVDEAGITHPIQGTSGFAREFEARGPTDLKNRSLRQFNLKTRLFEYPCSYMIYSAAFDTLPAAIKKHLHHQLWNILNGEDESGVFDAIPLERRRAIREILIETKEDLPVYWRL